MKKYILLLVLALYLYAPTMGQQLSIGDLIKIYETPSFDQQVLFLKKKGYDEGVTMGEADEYRVAEFVYTKTENEDVYKIALNFYGDSLTMVSHSVLICDKAPSTNISQYQSQMVARGFGLQRTMIKSKSGKHQMYIYQRGDWAISVSSLISKDELRCKEKASNVVLLLSKGAKPDAPDSRQ